MSYFVQKSAKQLQKRVESIPAAVMKGLIAWDWLGNIRELENFIERAVILTRDRSLEAPLSELHRFSADSAYRAAGLSKHEDIARMVKNTIAARNRRRVVADECSRRPREEIVRALTDTRAGWAAPRRCRTYRDQPHHADHAHEEAWYRPPPVRLVRAQRNPSLSALSSDFRAIVPQGDPSPVGVDFRHC